MGVNASFARKAMSTPPDAMWVPTIDELLGAGVVTRVIAGPESQSPMSEVPHQSQHRVRYRNTNRSSAFPQRSLSLRRSKRYCLGLW
jgi:hypothetical protein